MPNRIHAPNRERRQFVRRGAKYILSALFLILGTCISAPAARSSVGISVSPSSLNFGTEAVGGSSPYQVVTITNTTSSSYLKLAALSITAPFKMISSPPIPLTLEPGETTHVSLDFAPTTAGTFNGTLTVSNNSSSGTATVALTGTTGAASAPTVSLSPSSLTFASQTVGTTNAGQIITLKNTGQSTINISSIAVTGADASDFYPTSNCGPTVAAGVSCPINVSFTPAASGARTATLNFNDNCTGSPQTVSLSGTGASATPTVSLSPSSLTFASQTVGTTSASQTVTLTNTGQGALDISGITLTGTYTSDFSESSSCGSTLAAGANCSISVSFKPAASGALTAALSLADNATGSPQSVSLSGTGASATPTVSLSPSSLTFASQTVATTNAGQIITLKNTGQSTLDISSITVTGTDASDFYPTSNCGPTVAAGVSCPINVAFTPAASGARTATLNFNDNGTGSPQTVSLTGTGASTSATATLSSTSVSFGTCPVEIGCSTESVTLSNTGNTSLSLSGITLTGSDPGDFTENSTCGSSLAAGGTCTISILFTPAASGARTASVTVTDNAAGSPQSASLSGTGEHDVILNWIGSLMGLEGFNVYRGTASGGESTTPLNSTPIDGTTYTDVNVTAGTEYFYEVKPVAANGTVESATSNEASATVP